MHHVVEAKKLLDIYFDLLNEVNRVRETAKLSAPLVAMYPDYPLIKETMLREERANSHAFRRASLNQS